MGVRLIRCSLCVALDLCAIKMNVSEQKSHTSKYVLSYSSLWFLAPLDWFIHTNVSYMYCGIHHCVFRCHLTNFFIHKNVSLISWPISKSLLYHFHVHKNRITIWKLSEKAPDGWCNLREKFSWHLSEFAVIDEFVWIFVHSMFLPSCAPANLNLVIKKIGALCSLWLRSFFMSFINLGLKSMFWLYNSVCCLDWHAKFQVSFQLDQFCNSMKILLFVALRSKDLSNVQHASHMDNNNFFYHVLRLLASDMTNDVDDMSSTLCKAGLWRVWYDNSIVLCFFLTFSDNLAIFLPSPFNMLAT